MAFSKENRRKKIKMRIRKNLSGSAQKPRLAVYRSNREIYAQLINDEKEVTLATASSRDKQVDSKGSKSDVATAVGKTIAERAKDAGIEEIKFDRSGYLYHGRVKSLANGAREAGLKF
jgi:large subunit ribosomal protein L18